MSPLALVALLGAVGCIAFGAAVGFAYVVVGLGRLLARRSDRGEVRPLP